MRYDHDYGHYLIPSPTIKDPVGALEDATGSLTETHQLASDLVGHIEGMQDIARQQKERPGTIDPQAVNQRLESLYALAGVIDQRLKDSIVLLYAIIDHQNNEADAKLRAA